MWVCGRDIGNSSQNFTLIHKGAIQVQVLPYGLVNPALKISLLGEALLVYNFVPSDWLWSKF